MSKRHDLWRVIITGDIGDVCTYMVMDSSSFYAYNKALNMYYGEYPNSNVINASITRTVERIVKIVE